MNKNDDSLTMSKVKEAVYAIKAAIVEYVMQDYLKPMGVATYKQMQNRLRELLPPEEEMKRLITE